MTQDRQQAMARKGRVTGAVIAGGGISAILAQPVVSMLGLPMRYEFLIYLGALAAFVWALVNIFQLWRLRQDNR